ncbi:TetR/AcrR family transcriptional regulator [Prauserella cavernicola]|uniref:TetR family transcriptional regulator n=1 Tax=Prauserella cavernicola TaxID=2800127 RepID=A0A934QX96_9PSEU|nr:TetR family transcriptional regulator [Prauserella cavernicola]MBK1786974.1 TetR family transcriptional regulator [Prauserella cavernicola]
MAGRREQVLDAAIRVLGTQGTRGLTHRAVDAEAGAPAGTASNHFRTREALLSAVLERLRELETRGWERLAADLAGPAGVAGVDAFADAVGALARELTGPARVATLARHALLAEAAFHDDLRHQVALQRAEIESWAAEWFRALGSPHPERDLWSVLALLDGLLAHQCTTPDPDFAPEPPIRALVQGLSTTWHPPRRRTR